MEEEYDPPPSVNATTTNPSSTVSVHKLLPCILDEALRLYFTPVTLAIERNGPIQQDDALESVAHKYGTQELIPFFFFRFVVR